jgi:ABC-type multidrug transport system permease subunit
MALGFTLTMGEGANQIDYHAEVKGFSDRISSVLAPQTFIDYGNKKFGANSAASISRVILKVADPSQKSFTSFLEKNNYTTNAEQLRYSKMRSIVEIISGATGILALLLMAIGALVFILFIELTMAQAQASVKLLLQIGYSPLKLSRFLVMKYIPIMLSALLVSIIYAVGLQFWAAHKISSLQLHIATFPSIYVWLAAGISALILLWQISISIRKAINQ